MTVESKKPIMIFAKNREYNGNTFRVYSTGISSKSQDGTYNNAYIPVKFRRGIEIEDRQLINILSAWLMPIKIGENFVVGLFINDFNLTERKSTSNSVDNTSNDMNNVSSNNYSYNMDDLPF